MLALYFALKDSVFNRTIDLPVILILDMEAVLVEFGVLQPHLDYNANNTSG